jgi:acyl-CoA hydrolase
MFVAIDETTKKPIPVPPLVLDTEEARYRQLEAEKRREHRLAKSSR